MSNAVQGVIGFRVIEYGKSWWAKNLATIVPLSVYYSICLRLRGYIQDLGLDAWGIWLWAWSFECGTSLGLRISYMAPEIQRIFRGMVQDAPGGTDAHAQAY